MMLKAFWESTVEVLPRKHGIFTVNCLSFMVRQWFFSVSDKNVPFYACFIQCHYIIFHIMSSFIVIIFIVYVYIHSKYILRNTHSKVDILSTCCIFKVGWFRVLLFCSKSHRYSYLSHYVLIKEKQPSAAITTYCTNIMQSFHGHM